MAGPRVDVPLRTQEKQQLDKFVPMAVERLRDLGLGNEADDLDDVTIEIDETPTLRTRYVGYAEPDGWRLIVRHLGKLRSNEGLQIWWLRKKLAKRVHDRIEEVVPDEESDGEDDGDGD